MTVLELIEELKGCPDNAEVLVGGTLVVRLALHDTDGRQFVLLEADDVPE